MSDSNTLDSYLRTAVVILLGILVLVIIAFAAVIMTSPLQGVVLRAANALLGVGSVQAFWYVTRAAGLVAYLLLWLSTAWGLAVSSKIFDALFHRSFTYDMHQFISLLAIGFTVLHVVVLLADQYLPFSLAAILVPFVAPYRPVWVGIGIIGLYLTLLVSVTFYIRRWIGQKAFRVIHLASFVGYISVTLHGLMAGTDSPLWTVQLMYAGTALVIVFLTVHWLFMGLANRLTPSRASTSIEPRTLTR